MLASDVILRARDTLADPSGSRWDDTRLLRLLDEAQKVICLKSRLLRTSVDVIVHDKQSNYNLPSDLSLLTGIRYNDKPLEITTRDKLDYKLGYTWSSLTGTPEYAITADTNKGTITLVPTPSFTEPTEFDPLTANLITVFYIRKPSTITTLQDQLELDEDYKAMLVKYICGFSLRDDMDTQNRAFGNEELKLFDNWLKSIEADVAKDFTANISYTTEYRSMS